MADYFAVLSRTLAGFGEPKPELREKLYERARMTIRRQLDSHTPPLDEAALAAEMNKLEQAIRKVESDFGPPNVDLEPLKAEASKADQAKSTAKDKQPEQAKKDDQAAGKAERPTKAPAKKPEPPKDTSAKTGPVPDSPAPVKEKKGFLGRKKKRAEASEEVKPKPKDKPAVKAGDGGKELPGLEKTGPDDAGSNKAGAGKPTSTEIKDHSSEIAGKSDAIPSATPDESKKKPVASTVEAVAASDDSSDPEDEWAREFLGSQENSKPEVAEALGELQAERVKAKQESHEERAASIAATAVSQAASKTQAPDLPGFSNSPDESLTIPSATPTGSDKKSGGVLKWLLIAVLLLLMGSGLYLMINWENRAEIAARFGLDGVFGGTVKPTPVKTIKITPPVEPEETPNPESVPASPASESETDAPKIEDRLTGEDTVEEPLVPTPAAPESPVPATPRAGDGESQTGTDTQTESQQLPAAEAGDVPAIAQSAILYEEGGSPSDNSFDTGGVVWSRVEEQGGEGEGNVPAIRARVEVPSRQLVLIMTIKRNSDRALPASHLIELVFAVPEDFSGGSIQAINRFVLKQTEQDRGQALIGVPARISDGIFLIALNNLEAAQQTNEQLLTNRSWIDIPLQYRTGRRALVTLEKGLPGDAVFKEVFEAWEKLNNQP